MTARRLVLRPGVRAEIAGARRWYDERREGLGDELLAELKRSVDMIAEHPLRYPVVYRTVRRVLVRRFPYAVFYVIEPERVVVLAVLHQARDPASWPGQG